MTERRFWIVMAVLCAGIGAGVMGVVRRAERVPPGDAPAPMEPRERVRIPDVAQVLRACKLVTVEVRTGVDAASEDASWRGDVKASVRAPVTLYYGVDLAGLDASRVWRSPLTGGFTLRLPPPRRLAIEVIGDDAVPSVKVTGTRLRDVAGEYHLGLARVRLYDAARQIRLSPLERASLERATREQVAGLVRTLAGSEIPVEVVFDAVEDERPAGRDTAAGGEP